MGKRDGRFGIGRRDLGRKLMDNTKCDVKSIVLAGRWDDVWQIFKNRNNIDADVFFSKIEKIQGNWIPIIDTSASMLDVNDSYGKAVSIGHYLSKCSTYMPDYAISFSSKPCLLKLGEKTAEPPILVAF